MKKDTSTIKLEFQRYEIENILKALNVCRLETNSLYSCFGWSDEIFRQSKKREKIEKQLKFTRDNINRQLGAIEALKRVVNEN